VSEATSMPILVFLGLSVLELRPMYATDVRQKHRLMPRLLGAGHNNDNVIITYVISLDYFMCLLCALHSVSFC